MSLAFVTTIPPKVALVLAPTPEQSQEGTAAQALGKMGYDGAWLMRLAHAVAQHELKRTQSTLGDRYEDLVSWLTEVGLRVVVSYDASRSGNGYSFESYLWDVMERRIPDFYRRRGEGFGDRRRGEDGRLVLSAEMPDEDEFDLELDFGKRVSAQRIARWEEAARRVDAPSLEVWVLSCLDQYATLCIEVA